MKHFFHLLFIVISISAQLNTEQLLSNLENSEGNNRVDILNKISEEYRNATDNVNSIKYAEMALGEAKQLEYFNGQVNALNNISSIYILSQQFAEAEEYISQTKGLLKKGEYKFGIATLYRNIGAFYVYSNQAKFAVDTLKLSIEVFNEIEDSVGLASSIMTLGAAYTRTNEIEAGIELFEQAAEMFSKQGNEYQAAHAYLNLGSLYTSIMGNYEKGLTNALKALEKFESVNDQVKAAYAMMVIGNTYEGLGDLDKPIEYYSNALSIFEKTGNAYLIANAVNNLGEVYKHRREFSKAIEFYIQALEKSQEIENVEGIAVALNNLGECYFQLGNNRLAMDYYQQSFVLLEKMNDTHKMSISLNNQSTALLTLSNYSEAITKANRAIDLAKEVFANEEVQRGYEILYQTYKATGNYKLALENFQKYEEIKDLIKDEKRSDELEKSLAEYEAKQKEKEIELLTKNAELKELQLDRQENLTYFLIIFSVMLLGFSIVYFYRYVERKKINKELTEAYEKLNDINKTKDLFFSIIAHDLRGPFNSLLGITEILAEDNKELSHEEITNLSREVNQNARNVFLLLENLLEWSSAQLGNIPFNPQAVDINEIITMNINLYRKAASQKEINLIVKPGKDVVAFGDQNMIGAVARNLINNAIKFTNRGGNVTIETEKSEKEVIFSVQDTGIGMTKREIDKIFKLDSDVKKKGTENEKGTGLGLILCKEFINKNNGSILVTSEPGKGTIFTVKLPSQN
ncbi:MAG: tetratricopeptide repeat-containing sensor histidine kinase [Melioribacteraceae bacterium]|nr:tetratricopeptide repeat-containing sensor histidine kinase [Melioribacteraceae bacterium]